jgi:cation transport protein ChaC
MLSGYLGRWQDDEDMAVTTASPRWVFGYGSLIWRPGFAYLRSELALLNGAHRRLCIYSYRHRGTPERPGLVFGLVRGGSCRGMAFAVDPTKWDEVHDYLAERELDRGVYLERTRPVRLKSGEVVPALAFMVDERHVQYAGKLEIAEQARLVRRGVGESGANPEYVLATAAHLKTLGIRDRYLDELVKVLEGADLPVVQTV